MLLLGVVCGLVVALGLAGCDSGNSPLGSGGDTTNLSDVKWCDKPLVNFQDNSTTTQTVLTKWDDVKDQLGFTPYLPGSLPKGSCLVLAGGTIHNPIYGGQFKITYDLPNQVPLSFSEGPKTGNLGSNVQCVQNSQDAKTAVCVGTVSNTTVTIASRQSAGDLQNLFKSLQANVNWVPSDTDQLLATPTPATAATATPTK
jgi:hypothetical protein